MQVNVISVQCYKVSVIYPIQLSLVQVLFTFDSVSAAEMILLNINDLLDTKI